nr:MAG TPA: hypothetical protein [Caudoviricetes sp.]
MGREPSHGAFCFPFDCLKGPRRPAEPFLRRDFAFQAQAKGFSLL